jgi:transcriptional regulator with XRE-family HTH domain
MNKISGKNIIISKILYDLFEKRGVPISRVAKAIGVSYSVVFNLYQGRTKTADYEVIKKLADYFGVTPAQLLGEAPLPAREGLAAGAPDSFEIARRLELLERKINAGEIKAPTLRDEDRERLHAKYIRRGLVALRTKVLDAEGMEALYLVLRKIELAEEGGEIFDDAEGVPKADPRDGEGR